MYTFYKYSQTTNRLTPFTLDLKNLQQYPHYFSFNLFKNTERALGQMKLVDCNLSYVSVDYCFFYESLPEYAYDLLYPIVLNRWHMNPTHFTKRKDWKNYQLLYTHKGAGILVWKGKIFHLEPDSLCLLDCNQYHYFYADDPAGWDYSFIHFTGNGMGTLFELIEQRGLVHASLKGTFLQRTYETIIGLAKNNNEDFILLFHRYMTVLLTELAQSSGMVQERTVPPRLAEAQAYVIEHYDQPLAMEELATCACLSPSRFAHAFKEAFGLPPLEFQLRLRVEHAKEMLQDPEASIEEISERVGFSTVSSFYTKFRQLTGMPPGKYRKSLTDTTCGEL